jgi:acetyl-CoA C-acetyltransferase
MRSFLVSGARTPIGKLAGKLAAFDAVELGAHAIRAALRRGSCSPEAVDYIFMGQVLQAGQGQITARQAGAKAGIPMTVPATTVNKVCLSGLNAIYLAKSMVDAGDAQVVVAGGMESMTNAPYVLPGARTGLRYGHAQLIDSMLYDGLFCAFDRLSMGEATDTRLAGTAVTRERQDHLAFLSHERAHKATESGRLAREIEPLESKVVNGDLVARDEGIRSNTSEEILARLSPAFVEGGTITAGNSSQISDGAACVVVASEAALDRLGVEPLAELIGYGQVAGPDASLLLQPANAIRAALDNTGMSLSELDLFEINEAFAAVVLASMDDLGIDESIVNVNGGAIALGHPIGASGTRLALTLAHELKLRGGGTGVAALCGGGGQGDALVIKV